MPWYLEAPLSLIAGLLLANFIEWFFHKHVLHGLGRVRGRFWSFHFHEHHGNTRRHGFRDPCYERFPLGLHAQGKEAWALLLASLAASPLWLVVPWFTATLWYCAANYYRVHRRSHEDPDWARSHLPWHYDHHMGPNPHANWCVTRPWFDHLLGTREPYLGTERERQDQQRLATRAPAAS